MAGKNVTIFFYCNGRMTTGIHGLSYEGVTPKAIRVSYQIKYHEIMDKIYVINGYEKHQVAIKNF